ncbi:hypothetical protein HOF92_13175 [bacterium]|jgi:hypothetical protein|nr:hypothetical protein [bacterium]
MKKIVVFLVILISLGIVAFYLLLEPLLLRALNEGLDKTFQTQAQLNEVKLEVGESKLSLKGLAIASPDGFQRKEFLQLGEGSIQIQPSSLFEDTVIIEELDFENLSLQIAYDGSKINTEVLAPLPEKKEKIDWNKELLIRELNITGLKLFVRVPGKEREVEIPDIRIENLRVGKSPFPPMVHAIRQILDRILKEALKKYKEKYVTDLKDKLKQKVKEKVLDKVKLKLQNSGISESQLEDTAKSLKDKFKKFF